MGRASRVVRPAWRICLLLSLGVTAGSPAAGTPAEGSGAFLSGAPIDTLTATRERPLFVPSRRPPAPAPIPHAETRPPDAALANEPPRLTLLGVIRPAAGPALAVLQDEADHTSLTLKPGEAKRGWIVQSIGPDSVIVEKARRSVTLGFAKAPAAARLPAE